VYCTVLLQREEELQYLHCDTPLKGVEMLEIAV